MFPVMRVWVLIVAFMATCVAAQAEPATIHSREIAAARVRYAPLVRAVGRELVVFDADSLVRPFGDTVMGRTWDTVPQNARGSFEKISEATGERRAFSMIVRTDGKAQCRVGPTSPDQAWMNLLAAYSGHERQAIINTPMALTSDVFQRFVLLHEIGHCTDPHAFDRDHDPMRNLLYRHRAEAYADVFAILALGHDGVSARELADIVRMRVLYMSASASDEGDRKPGASYPSNATIAGYQHAAYWNVDAMKGALRQVGGIRAMTDEELVELAHYLVANDGIMASDLVLVDRALAHEPGASRPDAETFATDAENAVLGAPGGTLRDNAFDIKNWALQFDAMLKGSGASGEGPAAVIASERDRLRGMADTSKDPADADAIEKALARIAELATKGYAGLTDTPMIVSSSGGVVQESGTATVAAMPSRVDNPGPIPSSGIKMPSRLPTVSISSASGVRNRTGRDKPVKVVSASRLPQARPDAPRSLVDELTGISPMMAKVRGEQH
jgi:hypothetical protein